MDRGRAVTTRRSSAETRDVIRSSVAAIIEEHGVAGLSVAAVMRRAGITRTTFYRQYDDVYEAVVEIFHAVAAEIAASIGPWLTDPDAVGSPDIVYPNLLGYARAYARHGRLIRALSDASAVDPRVRRSWGEALQGFVDATAAAIARDQAAGAIRSDLDSQATAYALTMMDDRVAYDRLGDTQAKPEEFARILAPIWIATLFGDRGTRRARSI